MSRTKSIYGERVKCIDADGRIRLFPISMTSLYDTAERIEGKIIDNDEYKVTLDDLLSLKELVDALFSASVR